MKNNDNYPSNQDRQNTNIHSHSSPYSFDSTHTYITIPIPNVQVSPFLYNILPDTHKWRATINQKPLVFLLYHSLHSSTYYLPHIYYLPILQYLSLNAINSIHYSLTNNHNFTSNLHYPNTTIHPPLSPYSIRLTHICITIPFRVYMYHHFGKPYCHMPAKNGPHLSTNRSSASNGVLFTHSHTSCHSHLFSSRSQLLYRKCHQTNSPFNIKQSQFPDKSTLFYHQHRFTLVTLLIPFNSHKQLYPFAVSKHHHICTTPNHLRIPDERILQCILVYWLLRAINNVTFQSK